MIHSPFKERKIALSCARMISIQNNQSFYIILCRTYSYTIVVLYFQELILTTKHVNYKVINIIVSTNNDVRIKDFDFLLQKRLIISIV